MKAEPSPPRFHAFRAFIGVCVLNALLVFGVVYQSYKHFSTDRIPSDVVKYMALAQDGPEATSPPFRYRVLAPLLVRAMDALPGYGIAVDFTDDPAVRKLYFHFMILNFLLVVLTSGLLFLFLRSRVREGLAWAGSVLYLLSYVTVTSNLIPLTDAACHLAVIAAVLCLDRNRPAAFSLVVLAGVFAKETVLLVLGFWIVVHAVGSWRRLLWLALLIPGAVAYVALTRLYPAASVHAFYDPAYVLTGFLRVFDPATYTRGFLFPVVLGNLPLLAAFAGWLWLRTRGDRVEVNRGLWVFFGLLTLGIAMGIGSNAGRLAFMAFPAVALFQARVLQGLVDQRR